MERQLCLILFSLNFAAPKLVSYPVPDFNKNYKFQKEIKVNLPQGTIIGNKQAYTYEAQRYLVGEFLGIPFAESPVGTKRFVRPVKLEKFPENPFDAKKFGAGCRQNLDWAFEDPELYSDRLRAASYMWNVLEQSEDCLTINVWTPYPFELGGGAALKPVMLWIFGGGFYSGASNLDVYRGYRMAALEDVVVVTFNYRVGIFGFLKVDELENSGNQGLYDQIMAMEWVKENIRSFGGNPDKVTLYGESAGGNKRVLAMEWVKENIRSFGGNPDKVTLYGESAGGASVGIHLVSPLSRNLFNKAIMQSGSPTAVWAVFDQDEVDAKNTQVRRIVEKSACSLSDQKIDYAQCLQYQNAETLLLLEGSLWMSPVARYLTFPFAPYIDGEVIPDAPLEMLKKGDFANVPVMVGSNRNEGFSFIIYQIGGIFNDFEGSNPLNSSMYDLAMYQAFGTSPLPIFESARFYYRNWTDIENPISNRDALDDATGEQNFLCPINQLAEYVSTAAEKWPETHSENKVYMYSLQHRFSYESWPEWMGVVHGADVEWVFGKFLDHPNASREERTLNRNIMTHWANFARDSDPNIAGSSVKWPEWSNETQLAKNLDVESNINENSEFSIGPRKAQCAFWSYYIPKMVETVNRARSANYAIGSFAKSSKVIDHSLIPLVHVFIVIAFSRSLITV